MSLAEQKVAARKRAFAARRVAHARHRHAAAAALEHHLASLRGRVVAGYLPIRTEADPLPAMRALINHNRVCVPVVVAAGQPLVFREWHPGAALETGVFGVQVPKDGRDLVPDVLIVPLVAFDAAFFRLGYGGGFYDRTLQGLREAGPVRAIGLAFSAQAMGDLPREPTDQKLDEIVTEAGPLTPAR